MLLRPAVIQGEVPMPYRLLLARIQRLFGSDADAHLQSIEDGFKDGRLKVPSQPMTDQELAHAIREFIATPVSDVALKQFGDRLERG